MRLDHIAYRTCDRKATAQFFIDAFGYKIANEFDIVFDNGSTAACIALEPPEKVRSELELESLFSVGPHSLATYYHLAPEIFVSDGTIDSIVGQWVSVRDNVGGIHHIAYQVDNVRSVAQKWIENGWAEFAGDIKTCPEDDLEQIFTKPHPLTGVIYEFIKRGKHGFCQSNVKSLMESTEGNN